MPSDWWEVANKLGAIGFVCAVIFVWGLLREHWVLGKAHRSQLASCQRECDQLRAALAKTEQSEERWQNAAFELKGLTQQAVSLVKEAKS